MLVVAPSSAPMLVMVPLPVQLIVAAPGPKYSTIALVPPFVVRISHTFRMTSLGAVQPLICAGQVHADQLRVLDLPRHADHHVHRVGAAHAAGDHAQAAAVGRVAVGADDQPAGEGVVLQHDLVDDPRARLPEAHAVPGRAPSAGTRRPPGSRPRPPPSPARRPRGRGSGDRSARWSARPRVACRPA